MGVCQFNYVYSDYSKSTAAARLILRNQPGFFGAVHGTGLQSKVVQLVFFSKSAFSTLHRQILSNRYTLREQVQSSRYATSDSITILYSLQIEEQHRCRVQHTCSITTTTQSVWLTSRTRALIHSICIIVLADVPMGEDPNFIKVLARSKGLSWLTHANSCSTSTRIGCRMCQQG